MPIFCSGSNDLGAPKFWSKISKPRSKPRVTRKLFDVRSIELLSHGFVIAKAKKYSNKRICVKWV